MYRVFLNIFIFSLVMGTATIQAQNISLFGQLSIPVGDFGSTTSAEAGFAKMGFGAGLEVAMPIEIGTLVGATTGFRNINIIGQARILFNPVDDTSLREQLHYDMWWYWLYYYDLELMTLNLDIEKYINIPVMTGASIELVLNSNVIAFIKGLAGLNIAMFPEYKVPMTVYNDYLDQLYSVEAVSKTDGVGISYSISIEAGVTINDRVDLRSEFLYLGEPEFDGNVSLRSEGVLIESTDVTFAQSIAMINLSVGIRF